jgi:hypothetical protein
MKEMFSLVLFLVVVLTLARGYESRQHDYVSPAAQSESTEDKLRRSYDSQGIEYDEEMIRKDARAIEALNRELNK